MLRLHYKGGTNIFTRIRKIIIGAIVISIVLVLSACSNYSGEEYKKEVAAKLLQKKYHEKFVVYKTWGGEFFTALCSPVSDKSIKFEGSFHSNGEGSFMDGYPQGIVSKELETLSLPEIQKISEGCIVKPLVFYKDTEFINKKDVSIENYMKSVDEPRVLLVIIIDRSRLKNIGYDNEYKIFTELNKKCKSIYMATDLYYVDNNEFELCERYFETNADLYDNFYQIVKRNRQILFGYENGEINMSLDEFLKNRQQVM